MKAKSLQKKSGYTLIELLVYIAVLALMMTVVITTVIAITKVYRKVRVASAMEQNINTAMETITKEIRDASSVNTASSVFDSDSGALYLNTTDIVGAGRTVSFGITNGQIIMTEDSSVLGPLTSGDVTVSVLRFSHIDTGNSEGIRFYIELSAGSGEYTRANTFYNTVMLRGSYDI